MFLGNAATGIQCGIIPVVTQFKIDLIANFRRSVTQRMLRAQQRWVYGNSATYVILYNCALRVDQLWLGLEH